MASTPPHHAWAWFGRQRLLWRAVRRGLANQAGPLGERYRLVEDRDDVLAALKADYPQDAGVRALVHATIDREVFLGQAQRGLDGLGIRNAPRGLRWWLAAITDTDVPEAPTPSEDARRRQLVLDVVEAEAHLDDVRTGWGD